MDRKMEAKIGGLIISILGIFITTIIKKIRYLGYSYDFLKKLPVRSVEFLKKGLKKKEIRSGYIFVNGMLSRDDYINYIRVNIWENIYFQLKDFKIKKSINIHNFNPESRDALLLNPRSSTISLNTVRFDRNIFLNFFLYVIDNLSYFQNVEDYRNREKRYIKEPDHYAYNDYITVLGKIEYNGKNENFYIAPKIIAQGNKYTILTEMKNANIYYDNLIGAFCVQSLYYICSIIYNYYFKKQSNKILATNDENKCFDCKIYMKEILSLDCNHISYCSMCFQKNKKKCHQCFTKSQNYLMICNN